MTAYVAVTDEERHRNVERERAKMLRAFREAISAGTDMAGHNIRGVLFSVSGPEAAPDLEGVCAFTDMSFERELLDAVE